jgi:DNA-3-methyladenine glycosylase II
MLFVMSSSKTKIEKLDEKVLARSINAICRKHPAFKKLIKQHGLPSLRETQGGLEALLQMVTEQFLSLAAAAAIWMRLKVRLSPVTSKSVLTCDIEELMSLGLSRAKARSFHGIAEAVASGQMDFQRLSDLPDAEAHKALVALPGIGPWTADIYLLSVLLRPDAWPWGDVALQSAAQNVFGLAERPAKADMLALAEPFRPHRAVLARLLWMHYRDMRKLSQA